MKKQTYNAIPPKLYSGYLVKFRNGQYGIVACFGGAYFMLHTHTDGKMRTRVVKERYDDALKHRFSREWDVMEIIRPMDANQTNPCTWIDSFALGRGLIWKRPDERKKVDYVEVCEAAAKTLGCKAEDMDVQMPDGSTIRLTRFP